jgi:serine/threonine protein kinase
VSPLRGELRLRPTYQVATTMVEATGGTCYRSYHELLGRAVVQKTISLLGRQDSIAHEPALLKDLKHKHVVEVWEAQWDPDPNLEPLKCVTFVMPYYEGGSVADVLAEGHLFSVGTAVSIACQVLEALQYIHSEHRVLHRDVKPGNIFLDATRAFAYLGDFGSAARMTADGAADAKGMTRMYTPPEVIAGKYDVRAETYALGVTLFEMLNGALPYDELSVPTVDARLARGLRAMPERMLRNGPQVQPDLARVVLKMLSIDPSCRPVTALAAQRALQRCPHLNWTRTEAAGATSWIGEWPPCPRPLQGRRYSVEATPIERGRNRGYVDLTAKWRTADAVVWRSYRSLARRVRPDEREVAVAAIMRSVEASAR